MSAELKNRSGKALALAGAAFLCCFAADSAAQIPSPPAGFPPQGMPPQGIPPQGFPAGGPPAGFPGAPGGLPPGATEGALIGPPPLPPLTEAQKQVAALPPPMKGGLLPQPPVPADAPKPSADPRDFQGVWFHNQPLEVRVQKDMYSTELPFNMEGAQVLTRRVNSNTAGKPFENASAKCLPPGPQWQRDLNFPFMILQGKTWVEVIFEEYHGRWNISLDPAASPVPAGKEYMGRSVGHWEGDTLVVTSNDFKQALWLDVDGTPLSEGGTLTQRIRKVDLGNGKPFLEIVTTVNDPKYYTDPWNIVRTFGWQPNAAYFKEYNCEEQVGDPSGITDAGLIGEGN